MAGGIDELIDLLYGIVEDAWSMPLGKDKCLIERERVLDILDELRVNLPGAVKAARGIVEKRNELLEESRRDADAMKERAKEEAQKLVETNEIVREARDRAADILDDTEKRTREVKLAAADYCEDILKQTEDSITNALTELRQIRQQFRSAMENLR